MASKNAIERFLGDTYPLARHLVQLTAVFVLLLLCIFIARSLVPLLFPPSEYLTQLLHLVDNYAALLGIVGYTVWLTLDMFFLILEHGRKAIGQRATKDAEVDERNRD
jgi:small-conductance mechanosensitive channel